MAKRVIQLVEVTDDISGQVIPEGQDTMLTYVWDGNEYEIDLGPENATTVTEFMGQLTSYSRKGGKYKPSVSQPPRKAVSAPARPALTSGEMTPYQRQMQDRAKLREIRAWAIENGWPDHKLTGKLRDGVREAWNAAHPDDQAPDVQRWID